MSDFPFEYGSDLHWLWGWEKRIGDFLRTDEPVSQKARLVFRPDRHARDALLRYSLPYSLLAGEVDRCLKHVEGCFLACSEDGFSPSATSADLLCDGMVTLQSRIRTMYATIDTASQAATTECVEKAISKRQSGAETTGEKREQAEEKIATESWWHDSSEVRPPEYKHGPMIGQKKQICAWMGEKPSKNMRRLEQKANKAVWVIRLSETSWEVWFKDERTYQAADNQRRFHLKPS